MTGPADRRSGPLPARPAAADEAVQDAKPAGYRAIDPRAVRAAVGATSAHAAVVPLVLEPPAIPLAPVPRASGRGILGGVLPPGDGAEGSATAAGDPDPSGRHGAAAVLVDGEPVYARLIGRAGARATLEIGEGTAVERHAVLLGVPAESSTSADGVARREVVVGGWRVEIEIESERRAALRERASRGRSEAIRGGPTEVRAIIPGRVVSVSVVADDDVVAGQQLLVVEAMKMQNELRAPRDGRIERVAVAAGETIEVGDLLLVIN